MPNMEQDNVIQWLFEKAFNQLTMDGKEIYQTPFHFIKRKTFENEKLHLLLNQLSKKSLELVKSYLTNADIQQKFLYQILRKKLHIQILYGNLDKLKELIGNGYRIDDQCAELAILNNMEEILDYLVQIHRIKLSNAMLMNAAKYGYEKIYFYLREKNLIPNISIYQKAVVGGSIKIVQDVSESIGLSAKILKEAFEANHTDTIIHLLEQANKEKVDINNELVHYPILNGNMALLRHLETNLGIKWEKKMYHSAILSGSIEMVQYLESKIPNIHENHSLDHGHNKKGQMSLLLEDMIYQINNKNYFSHAINYALQSGSINMLVYVHQKGYSITPSNFITAIKQGTVEMVDYLSQNYLDQLPFYFVHYFGPYSYLPDKLSKARILYQAGLLNLDLTKKMTINDYKKENAHLGMILNNKLIMEDASTDPDFLMKYHLFFVPKPGFRLNFRLIARIRVCLALDLDQKIEKIFHETDDKQLLVDLLFLFGNIQQIDKFYPLVFTYIPSIPILMEITCCRQIEKLGYLYKKNLFTNSILEKLCPIATMLSDECLSLLFPKINTDLKYLVLSGRKDLVEQWFYNHPNVELGDKETIKQLCLLDDVELIKKFRIKTFPGMAEWLNDNDLLEVKKLLFY